MLPTLTALCASGLSIRAISMPPAWLPCGAKPFLRKRCFSVGLAATRDIRSCSAFAAPPTQRHASPATFVSSPTRPGRAATLSTRLGSSYPEVRPALSPRPEGSSSTSGSILVASSGVDRRRGTAITLLERNQLRIRSFVLLRAGCATGSGLKSARELEAVSAVVYQYRRCLTP